MLKVNKEYEAMSNSIKAEVDEYIYDDNYDAYIEAYTKALTELMINNLKECNK